MKETYSISRRLISWIGLPILIASVLIILIASLFTWHEIEEIYDAQLVHSAKVLLQLTQHDITQKNVTYLGVENPDLNHKYERKMGFRVWANDALLTQSPNTQEFGLFEAPPGFSNQAVNGHSWRFFVFIDSANNIKIETSERYDVRYELIGQLIGALVIPSAFLIPIIIFLVWIGVRKFLKPVINISTEVDQRNSADLMPIHTSQLPTEITPLIRALNRLFERLTDSFQREREFTDHAAHELRTPLAAMKTQTQVLLRKASALPECRYGLENLESSINRATHMINQLLLLARIQHTQFPVETVDLSSCLQEKIAEMQQSILNKNLIFKAKVATGISVQGHTASIAIMLGNLLDNAIKYTPSKGIIHVSLDESGLFTVEDTGPGLSDSDKKKVFERFVRLDKSGENGSGLGLSIASWIAQQHNLRIELSDNHPSGLRAQIQWNI